MVKTKVGKQMSSWKRGEGSRTQGGWKYSNPQNEKRKRVRNRTYKWCTNDCHDKPMWCGRRTCLSNAEYSAKMNKGEQPRSNVVSKDFKIALAALTTAEDYAALEEQFFQVKD